MCIVSPWGSGQIPIWAINYISVLSPSCSFRWKRCVVFLGKELRRVKQLLLPPQRRVVWEVARKLLASLRELPAKCVGTKGLPVNTRRFYDSDNSLWAIHHSSFEPPAELKTKWEVIVLFFFFPKSCSWMWWPPLKPCQRDVFILLLFFWNPFSLPHLLWDLTPQPDIMFDT